MAAAILLLTACDSQPEEVASESTNTTPAIADVAPGSTSPGTPQDPAGEWAFYGGNNGANKYSALDQIDASNVNRLEASWRRPALDQYYTDLNPDQRFSANLIAAPSSKMVLVTILTVWDWLRLLIREQAKQFGCKNHQVEPMVFQALRPVA